MKANHYEHGKSLVIYDSTPAQNMEDSRKLASKQDAAEKLFAIDNLSSEYHPTIFDKGIYDRANTWMEFVEWRMTTEIDHTIDVVDTVETRMYVTPTEGRDVFYNKGGLRMANSGGHFNFRDTGMLATKAHNLEKRATDFMTGAEGYEFAIEHPDLLSKAPNIDWIVIGKMPGSPGAVYGVAQISKDSALLFGNIDSYRMIDEWAMREGIDTDALIRRAMGEEYAHLVRRGKAGVPEEKAVRVWLIDMYTKLADTTLDARAKGEYMKMVSHLKKDLATVKQRYSRSNRNVESFVEMYMSDASKLEMVLEAEAMLEYGLTDEGEIAEYVSGKLEQIAEAAEKGEYVDAEMAEYETDSSDGDGDGEVCATAEGDSAEDGGDNSGDSGGE